MTLITNLYAGPGTGKSTTMAGLFAELKMRGVNCEMAPEYAKEKVWENSLGVFDNQAYVFAKQHHTIKRLIGKVDVVITDAPILLSLIYGGYMPEHFKEFVRQEYHSMNNFDVFLKRSKPYNPAGRLQGEERAKEIDGEIQAIVRKESDNDYFVANVTRDTFVILADEVEGLLGRKPESAAEQMERHGFKRLTEEQKAQNLAFNQTQGYAPFDPNDLYCRDCGATFDNSTDLETHLMNPECPE